MPIANNTIVTPMDLHQHIRGVVTRQDYNFFNNVNGGTESRPPVEFPFAATMYKIQNGKRQPMVKTTNNPSLMRSTKAGLMYFGQQPIVKMAIDQVLHRAAAVFPTGSHGAGGNAFSFMNGAEFSGSQSISSILGTLIGGVGGSELLTNTITQAASTVGSILGANSGSAIDLSKGDEIVQLLQGVSTFFAGADHLNDAPFSPDVLNNGVQYAKSVTQYIQEAAKEYT